MQRCRNSRTTIGPDAARTGGFTLVELLIAVGILLILVVITVTAVNVTANQERIPGAARDVQSFIEGARDRAIFRGQPVGVRLYLDPNGVQNGAGNPVTVNSMAYVATPPLLQGFLDIQLYPDGDPMRDRDNNGVPDEDRQSIVNIQNDAPGLWDRIRRNRGLVDRGVVMQIEIMDPTTRVWSLYRMAWDESNNSASGDAFVGWKLTKPYNGSVNIGLPYKLTLLPSPMANQTTRDLPSGVSINLESSRVNGRIPRFWYRPQNSGGAFDPSDQGSYMTYLDIMFTPSGTGVGAASGAGMIQLHVASAEDMERASFPALSLGNPRNVEFERLVMISPVTGNISVSDIPKFADADQDDLPDGAFDPYKYAELGNTAP